MKNLKSFKSLIPKYDFFLFDQWGVLHNGHFKFENAENCLKILKKNKKKIILISNSSRPTEDSISNLTKLGFDEYLYDYCITSGQIAINNIEKDIYAKYGKTCYPLKMSNDKIKSFKLKCTKEIKNADFVMIADLDVNLSVLDFAKTLDEMLELNLPLLCANPDYLVYDKEELSMCGGTVAQLYEDMGGKVFRYGKPYKPIYSDIIKTMKIRDFSKVLVVGDSLWHDIAGGNLLNFDSLWVKSGVHTPQIDKGKEISDLLDNYKPKYAISELKI
ncbi:TIGR01459 family HAD-type hydrolase [Alphaproteobacteria bacterium]|nr:TIGR01459 family HAD-type hydrolase [Alphaproteobacteria bacterium]